MIKRLLFLLFISLFVLVSGCSFLKHKSTETAKAKNARTSQQAKFKRFNNIKVKGAFDVELLAGINRHDIRLIGKKSDIQHIHAYVANRTLFLTSDAEYKPRGRTLAIIRTDEIYDIYFNSNGKFTAIGLNTPTLNLTAETDRSIKLSGKRIGLHNVHVSGRGPITIKGVNTKNLNIIARGNNYIKLRGKARLRRLAFAGNGRLDLYWVDSPYLLVEGKGNGSVKLAGNVDVLEMNLHDSAHFDGRYLRTKTAYVKTRNTSRADLLTTKKQNTLAFDASNIYFYKKAKFQSNYMAYSGSVLNMNGVN